MQRHAPIPSEQNPRGHHECPGQPPANWAEGERSAAEPNEVDLYNEEEHEREEELLQRRHEPLKNPNTPR
jgi:hypothetical protein